MNGLQQIAELQGGSFGGQIADTLRSVVQAVDETGKAGKVTVTLDIAKSAGGTISIVAKVTDKTPEPKPDADVYWPTPEGNLARDNPKQRKLDLKAVDEGRGALKKTDDEPPRSFKSAS